MKIGQYLAKIWTRVYCAVFLAHPVYSCSRPTQANNIHQTITTVWPDARALESRRIWMCGFVCYILLINVEAK